jgi:hypothetical protein
MTLRIDRHVVGNRAIIHLVGKLRIEHLDELKAQIGAQDRVTALDVRGVSLISVEGVRFLSCCEASGIAIRNASPYISKWMALERKFLQKSQKKRL